MPETSLPVEHLFTIRAATQTAGLVQVALTEGALSAGLGSVGDGEVTYDVYQVL